MSATGLSHAAIDRKIVRDICDAICVPFVFSCLETKNGFCIGNIETGFKVNQKYIDGKKKADEMFQQIMADPEMVKKIVASWVEHRKEVRIEELESELKSLRDEEGVNCSKCQDGAVAFYKGSTEREPSKRIPCPACGLLPRHLELYFNNADAPLDDGMIRRYQEVCRKI